MRYCADLCEVKGTTICCADCSKKDCELRCEGVEYGSDVDCKLLETDKEARASNG